MAASARARWSLQTWILLLTVVICVAVLFASDFLTLQSSIRIVERQLMEQSAKTARNLAAELARLPPERFPVRFQTVVRDAMEMEPTIVRVDVYADYGQELRLVESSSNSGDRPLEGKEVAAYYTGQPDAFIIQTGINRRIFSIQPVRLSQGLPGFLSVVSSLQTVDQIWNVHARYRLYSVLISILLLTGAIVILFRATVYRSVHHLMEVMHGFQRGDTTRRAKENLTGEFGELARNFNAMLEEIHILNTHMQEEIQEATAELAQRNRALQEMNLQMYELQKRLAQTERLALVGQLTATFAHEIGSPLSAVSTHLQLLLEERRMETRHQERVRTALDQIDRVCGIVEDLLVKTRRETRLSAIELDPLLRRVVQLLGPTLESRQVRLDLRLGMGPFMINGNPDELQQLFLNLFNNALDALQERREIQVRMNRTGPSDGDPRSWIQVDIMDTGTGIAPEQLDRIFEPFFTTKDFGRGTGLGLALCREIVRHHGGTISAVSQPGQGSCFSVHLPAVSTESIQ